MARASEEDRGDGGSHPGAVPEERCGRGCQWRAIRPPGSTTAARRPARCTRMTRERGGSPWRGPGRGRVWVSQYDGRPRADSTRESPHSRARGDGEAVLHPQLAEGPGGPALPEGVADRADRPEAAPGHQAGPLPGRAVHARGVVAREEAERDAGVSQTRAGRLAEVSGQAVVDGGQRGDGRAAGRARRRDGRRGRADASRMRRECLADQPRRRSASWAGLCIIARGELGAVGELREEEQGGGDRRPRRGDDDLARPRPSAGLRRPRPGR